VDNHVFGRGGSAAAAEIDGTGVNCDVFSLNRLGIWCQSYEKAPFRPRSLDFVPILQKYGLTLRGQLSYYETTYTVKERRILDGDFGGCGSMDLKLFPNPTTREHIELFQKVGHPAGLAMQYAQTPE